MDGPFAETKELVAGFWIWQVKSMAEAIEWVRRCRDRMPGESIIEIRPVFEPEDFGEALTPELREKEQWLRDEGRSANRSDALALMVLDAGVPGISIFWRR